MSVNGTLRPANDGEYYLASPAPLDNFDGWMLANNAANTGIPFVVGATSASINNNNTNTIAVPAAVADGDLLVLKVASSSVALLTYTGWTLVGRIASGGGQSSIDVLVRFAASEPANYTIIMSSFASWAMEMTAYRNTAGLGVMGFIDTPFATNLSSRTITAQANSIIETTVCFDADPMMPPNSSTTMLQQQYSVTSGRNGLITVYEYRGQTAMTTSRRFASTSGNNMSLAVLTLEILGVQSTADGYLRRDAGIVVADVGAVSSASLGTASIALGELTANATGTLAITGQAAPTLGALISAATGALAIQGTAAATLDPLTVSAAGSGSTAINGAAAITLADLTVASTGTMPIVGTASATLGALTVASTGTLLIAGQATITLGALTAASTGTMPIAAAANITLAPLGAAATGVLPIVGQTAATLDPLTTAAIGVLAIVGQASATLDPLTVAATGTGGVTSFGLASITLDDLTMVAVANLSGAPVQLPSDGPSGWRRVGRARAPKSDEWLIDQLDEAATVVEKPLKTRKRFVADFMREVDSHTGSQTPTQIDAIEALIARIAEPRPDYTAIANAVAAEQDAIKARQRRRMRDEEAIMILAA